MRGSTVNTYDSFLDNFLSFAVLRLFGKYQTRCNLCKRTSQQGDHLSFVDALGVENSWSNYRDFTVSRFHFPHSYIVCHNHLWKWKVCRLHFSSEIAHQKKILYVGYMHFLLRHFSSLIPVLLYFYLHFLFVSFSCFRSILRFSSKHIKRMNEWTNKYTYNRLIINVHEK